MHLFKNGAAERRTVLRVLCSFVLAGVIAFSAGVRAQQADDKDTKAPAAAPTPAPVPAPATASQIPTAEQIEARIKQLSAATDLDEELKKKLLQNYELVLSRLQAANVSTDETARLKAIISSAAETIKTNEEKLKEPISEARDLIDLPQSPKSKQIEESLGEHRQNLTKLQAQEATLITQLQRATTRPADARMELTKATAALKEIEDDLKVPVSEDTPLVTSQQMALRARRHARLAEIEMLNLELQSYKDDLHSRYLQSSLDLVRRQIKESEAVVALLDKQLAALRKQELAEAEREAAMLKKQAQDKHPVVQALAAEVADLSKELLQLEPTIEKTKSAIDPVKKQLEQITRDLASDREGIQRVGMTPALGAVLQDRRRSLPDAQALKKAAAKRTQSIESIELRLWNIDDALRDLVDVEKAADLLYQRKVKQKLEAGQAKQLKADAGELLIKKRDQLKSLSSAYRRQLYELSELESVQTQLVEQVSVYRRFLDQRLLWIRSNAPLGTDSIVSVGPALSWLCAVDNWQRLGSNLVRDFQSRLHYYVILLVTLAPLLVFRHKLVKRLEGISQQVGDIQADRFVFTIEAVAWTALLSATFAWPIWFLGWRLSQAAEDDEFSRAVGSGLLVVAGMFLGIQFLRTLCGSDGVGPVHLRWRSQSIKHLRNHLLWLGVVLLPLVFVIRVMEVQTENDFHAGLGRLCFLLAALAIAVFTFFVLNPKGGLPKKSLSRNPQGWIARLKYIWFAAAIALSLGLATLAALGFYYSALRLESRVTTTIVLVIGTLIIHALIIRWFIVVHRRLAVKTAQEKQEAEKARRLEEDSAEASDEPPVNLDIPEIDLSKINEQTRYLLRMLMGTSILLGVWLIWAGVLPALDFLDQINLWSWETTVDGQTKQLPVTLKHLLLAGFLTIIACVATKNLPGVLEIAVLQRLSIDHGSRYAITTLTQYALAIVGVVVVFNVLGFSWSKLQWIVAALGVGLGFGLQEIVANFVSGLILLFERPVRVGDTVTVGDINGTVSRIRIRATTITDWDNKELIVPNKIFITDRLINWTLSDQTIRQILNVGIAYGSDTKLAHKVMLEVVTQHPHVLDDPQPQAIFRGFGSSSLDFEIRYYIRGLSQWVRIVHDLHMNLDMAFREAGIEISFPQRDLHIRTAPAPLTIQQQIPEVES